MLLYWLRAAYLHRDFVMATPPELHEESFQRFKKETSLRGLNLQEMMVELIQCGLSRNTAHDARPKRSLLPILRKPTGTIGPMLTKGEIEATLIQEDARG